VAVLVTGGGGHMVWNLLDSEEEVVAVDRLPRGHRWAIAQEARFYEGDICDISLLSKISAENEIDTIIHFAGSIIVPESVAYPLAYYENNTIKSRSLIAWAVETGIKHFVFSSTAAVYGTPEGTEPRDRSGQYSKVATHLIKIAAEVVTGKRDYINVFGTDYPTSDGTCIRDYIHVSDLVDAHYKALIGMRRGGGPLVANCGYGRGFSVREVLGTIQKVIGKKIKIGYAARRSGDAVSIVANPTLATRELGWRRSHDNLNEIIRLPCLGRSISPARAVPKIAF